MTGRKVTTATRLAESEGKVESERVVHDVDGDAASLYFWEIGSALGVTRERAR